MDFQNQVNRKQTNKRKKNYWASKKGQTLLLFLLKENTKTQYQMSIQVYHTLPKSFVSKKIKKKRSSKKMHSSTKLKIKQIFSKHGFCQFDTFSFLFPYFSSPNGEVLTSQKNLLEKKKFSHTKKKKIKKKPPIAKTTNKQSRIDLQKKSWSKR